MLKAMVLHSLDGSGMPFQIVHEFRLHSRAGTRGIRRAMVDGGGFILIDRADRFDFFFFLNSFLLSLSRVCLLVFGIESIVRVIVMEPYWIGISLRVDDIAVLDVHACDGLLSKPSSSMRSDAIQGPVRMYRVARWYLMGEGEIEQASGEWAHVGRSKYQLEWVFPADSRAEAEGGFLPSPYYC